MCVPCVIATTCLCQPRPGTEQGSWGPCVESGSIMRFDVSRWYSRHLVVPLHWPIVDLVCVCARAGSRVQCMGCLPIKRTISLTHHRTVRYKAGQRCSDPGAAVNVRVVLVQTERRRRRRRRRNSESPSLTLCVHHSFAYTCPRHHHVQEPCCTTNDKLVYGNAWSLRRPANSGSGVVDAVVSTNWTEAQQFISEGYVRSVCSATSVLVVSGGRRDQTCVVFFFVSTRSASSSWGLAKDAMCDFVCVVAGKMIWCQRYVQVCNPVPGPTVFCVDTNIADGRDGYVNGFCGGVQSG